VSVLIGSLGQAVMPIIDRLDRMGCHTIQADPRIAYHLDAPPSKQNSAPDRAKTGPSVAKRALSAAGRLVKAGRLLGFVRQLLRGQRVRRLTENLINSLAPSAVLFPAFNSVGQLDNGIMRATKQRGIPAYCTPNTPYLGHRVCTVARLNHLESGMAGPIIRADYDWVNRFIALICPRWTAVLADGTRVFYWDPLNIVAAKLNGLGYNEMWLKPSLDFARVFVFSEFSRRLLREDKYPADKIVVAGQPALDRVFTLMADPSHRIQIFTELGLAVDQPFALLNIEPAAEHNYCPWEQHERNVKTTIGAVRDAGLAVVLSLHPLCDTPHYEKWAREAGVTIAERRIHELYPYCAVSVSFPCSTNLLAETFDKPLVIYDHFGLIGRDADSDALNRLPGAEVCTKAEALTEAVSRLASQQHGGIAQVATASATIADCLARDLSSRAKAALAAPAARHAGVR
jgi:hypothetical protein